MRSLGLAALAFGLAGCAAAPPPPPAAPIPGPYVCSNQGLDRYAGQPASQALGAEMLRVSGARLLQWVGHGMMVTMEFNPQRLRVFLTADNRVERASCG